MKKYSNEKENNILKLYDLGSSISEIAKFYNTFNTSIKRVLKRNNRTTLTSSETNTSVKFNPFEKIENTEVQYWLGMLCSDGNIYKTRVSLDCSIKDVNHLEKYKQFIGSKNIINYNTHKKFNTVQCSFRFKNKNIVNYLNSLGIKECKSYSLKVNFPITYDFLRGALDGDGCMYLNKKTKKLTISLATASLEFKNQITEFLKQENIRHGVYMKDNSLYIINVCAKKDLIYLISKLYKDSSIFLERKKQKCLDYLNLNNLC